MLQRLEVPYLDASAEQLVWQLDAPIQSALAERRVERSWCTLDLRLLGASHQVIVRTGAEHACSELVACRPGVGGNLPSHISRLQRGLRYRFSSAVEVVVPDELAARAEELVRLVAGHEDALVGAFPGSPHAVTAIVASATGWRSWHLYPQSGQVVSTHTEISPNPARVGP